MTNESALMDLTISLNEALYQKRDGAITKALLDQEQAIINDMPVGQRRDDWQSLHEWSVREFHRVVTF